MLGWVYSSYLHLGAANCTWVFIGWALMVEPRSAPNTSLVETTGCPTTAGFARLKEPQLPSGGEQEPRVELCLLVWVDEGSVLRCVQPHCSTYSK